MPRDPKNFSAIRADLAHRVGEERVAAAERAELERYEQRQVGLGLGTTSGSKRASSE